MPAGTERRPVLRGHIIMKDEECELQLIRLCTLMDAAALGERRETIMHLLHSARRASRAGQRRTAAALCSDARHQLRKVRHSLRAAGAGPDDTGPVESAIAMLSMVFEAPRTGVIRRVELLFTRCLLVLILAPVCFTALMFGVSQLYIFIR